MNKKTKYYRLTKEDLSRVVDKLNEIDYMLISEVRVMFNLEPYQQIAVIQQFEHIHKDVFEIEDCGCVDPVVMLRNKENYYE